jgi:hypothetical protein
VAVEKIVRYLFIENIMGRKGTDFAPRRRHPSMIIGSDLGGLEGTLKYWGKAHLSKENQKRK